MMYFQTEHKEVNSYQKLKSMTTALAIKCESGIVLASDNQGTLKNIKIETRKIFKISDSLGLVGAGTDDQTIELVEHLQKYLEGDKFYSELPLKRRIREALTSLNAINNVIESARSGYLGVRLLFNPHALIGIKLENGKFCLYEIIFGPYGENGEITAGIAPINDYRAIVSGSQFAIFIIKQQNRIHNLDKLDINVGIASYVIGEAKDIDLLTGKNTSIAVIDNNGFRDVSNKDQIYYYNKMIDNASSMTSEQSNGDGFKEMLKSIFPYN